MSVKDPVVDRVRDEMVDYLKLQDAFWQWQDQPRTHAHVAELTSGKLSDFFANLSPLYTNVFLQESVGWALVYKAFYGNSAALHQHDNLWVIGPAMGAIGLAQSVARAVRAYNPDVRCGFTEPVYSHGVKTKRTELKRFGLGKDPCVIIVEDVMTTGGTTEKTMKALIEAGGGYTVTFVEEVLVVVDRRMDEPTGELMRHKIVSLMRVRPRVWDSVEDLPPEMQRCTPIRPKENWEALTTSFLGHSRSA